MSTERKKPEWVCVGPTFTCSADSGLKNATGHETCGPKQPEFSGFVTKSGLACGDDRIMPGAFKEAFDVPVRVNFQGEVYGKAHVTPDGLVEIELNEKGVEFMKTFRGFDFGGFDYDEDDE